MTIINHHSNNSSPSSSVSSSSSSINLPQTNHHQLINPASSSSSVSVNPNSNTNDDGSQLTSNSPTPPQPGWTHIEDEEDDEEDEEEDRLWEINPASPASLHHARQRRIPSITLIDPQADLKTNNTLSNTTINNQSSTSSLLSSLSNSPLTPRHPPPPPPPPLTVAHHLTTPTEEWRSKILNSVRKGEEKVAQRRKQSLASLDSTAATQPTTSSLTHPTTSIAEREPISLQSPSKHQTASQSSSSSAIVPPLSLIPPALDSSPTPILPGSLDLKGKQPANDQSNHPRHSSSTIGRPSVQPAPISGSLAHPITSQPSPDLDPSNTVSTNIPYLDALKPDLTHLSHNQHAAFNRPILPISTPHITNDHPPTTPPKPSIPSRTGEPASNDSPASIYPKRPSDSTRSYSHIRSNSNSITELPSRPVIPTSLLSRSNSAVGRAQRISSDERAFASRNIGSPTDALNLEPPPPVDGTFLTVVEPDLSSRLAATHPSSESASSDPSQAGSNFTTSPNPHSDQFGQSTSNHRNPSTTRSKTGKRNFFSTLLQRASGSNSNPTSPGPSSAPGSASRNPFESTFNRPTHSDGTLRGPHNRLGLESHGTSSQPMDAANSDKTASPGMNSSYATALTLGSMNLKISPLTPTLPASRNSQPLCGAILDDKFLLIGTNSGLDFVPLTPFTKSSNSSDRSRGSVHTVKPISLIKKTRFKSLKVLEVRSNILLAIAGRNDHLRVYALDGIRAIVSKKIQDLEEKEDFVWLPKTLARVTPHKGKERVANAPAQPNASNSPQYSPPPPYGGKLGPGQTMAKSSSCQPTTVANQPSQATKSPVKTALRRSSTVGSRLPSGTSAFEVADTRRSSLHSTSDSSSFVSPLGLLGPTLTSALQSLRAENSDQLPTNHMALGRDAVQVGLEQATEERENGSSQRGPPPIINTDDVLARRPNMTGIHEGERTGKPEPNNGQGEPAGTALVEVIKKRSQLLAQAGKRIPNPNLPIQPITSSRLVPRSALATDTDNESVDGSQVNLVDVLSQPAANSAALGISASAPAREPRTSMGEVPSVLKKPTANTQSVPGPPLNAPNDVHPQINVTDEIAELGHHPIVGSTSLPRAGLNPVADDASRANSATPSALLSSRTPSRVPSGVNSDQENQPSSLTVPSRSKKRWSVMDSVFRTHNGSSSSSGSSNNNSHSNSPNPAGPSGLLPARSSADDSLVRSASCNQFSPSPFSEAANGQQNPTLRSRPSTQKLRSNVSESNAEFGAGGSNSSGPTILNGSSGINAGGMSGGRGEFEDQPRERLATHFHGQNASETAKTSPHPATLGAPLEYVKLARTKGAKLLRAYETRRRTYLAVLCGESSERIELFTGSKNISLSLNRTFVLPETPRTIEFQMQGDDLVDIYLVYDESVFALEPATVRVREVGIGRNERRAARRERERAARDLASINMRPAVTATGSNSSAVAHQSRRFMNDPTESLMEAVGAPARSTISASPSTVDDGLTLSAPVPSSSFRQASAANTTSIASGWGSHDSPVASGGNHPGAAKVPNLWPYTTFQQLQFIPPLPPSVLASTFVIPPTYEAVVTASGGPRAVQNSLVPPDEDPARTLSPINVVEPESENLTIPLNLAVDQLSINNGSSSVLGEAGSEAGSSIANSGGSVGASKINASDGSEAEMEYSDSGDATVTVESGRQVPVASPNPQTILADGPLLSPISLLSNPASRQIGPPGLFLVTRGKKVTSIVDCDGRSVMKKPFIWMNDKHSKPSGSGAENGQHPTGFRIEVVLIDERRTVLVGLDHQEVKLFEVGGRQAKGLEEFSNSATLDILPHLILGGSPNGPTSLPTGVGGGNGVGVITAQSFPSSHSFRDHHPHHHSTLNLSSLTNLTIGLSKWSDSSSHSNHNNHNSGGSSFAGSLSTPNQPSNPSSSSPGTGGGSGLSGNSSSILIPPVDREVVFLASSVSRNSVIWSERIGNSFAIYSLSSSLPFVSHSHPTTTSTTTTNPVTTTTNSNSHINTNTSSSSTSTTTTNPNLNHSNLPPTQLNHSLPTSSL
ncbi:hypothetical protein PGT21_012301 [Puccinia graminis f. sp. tritici]|uniref:CNH domain-containing protein n=1 Tax=Puccinia graminis f. sp. tritici TaxID=56615 RepID=A0A5B0MDA8_PUCGR|nr:hypothetical protein PGTUg99_005346 [Puccinia graminis f. sp. tritici]KAA1090737.1 hypothetical protein PGT21_012301 [Puccinia graminis f. sp. tritici]